jgi:polyhydroxyalkanoate synthesis regulator phasin
VSKRTMQVVVIAVFAAILVVGVGVGAADGGLTGSQDTFLNDVAKRLNVTPAELQAALKGAASDQIDAAVKAGKLTQDQADALKKRLDQGDLPGFGFGHRGGGPGFGPGLRFGFGHGGIAAAGDAASTYLGLTQQELFTQLVSGKSLAQIAKDKGKSVDGLKKAITDASKAKLDAAVKAGDLTQAQADALLQKLTDNLDTILNATPPLGMHPDPDGDHHGFFGGRHGGFGPIGGGTPPQGSSRFTPIPA